MRIITLLNEKGGVGKTTMTTHIAAGLAIRGYKVLVIDGDPQAHTTIQFGLKEWGGLYRLIIQADEWEWEQLLKYPNPEIWAGKQNVKGILSVLPGNVETRGIPMMTDKPLLLRERLKELREHVDVVLIDTSPTPSMLINMFQLASSALLYPTQAQYLSLRGLAATMLRTQEANELRKANRLKPLVNAGVIPTMVRANTAAHQNGLEKIEAKFGHIIMPSTALRTVWEDASYDGKLMYAYAPQHEATDDMWAIVDAVEKVVS